MGNREAENKTATRPAHQNGFCVVGAVMTFMSTTVLGNAADNFSGRTNSNNEAETIAEEHASAHDVFERL